MAELLYLTIPTGETERLPIHRGSVPESAALDLARALRNKMAPITERPECQLMAEESPTGDAFVAAVHVEKVAFAMIVATKCGTISGQFWDVLRATEISTELVALATEPPQSPWCATHWMKPELLDYLGIPDDWLRAYCSSIALAWFSCDVLGLSA